MSEALVPRSITSASEEWTLIDKVLNEQPQKIWHMVTFAVQGLKEEMAGGGLNPILPVPDVLIVLNA